MNWDNIVIAGIATSYPEENLVSYQDIEEHFENTKVRIKSLMKILGKNQRYCVTKDANYYDLLEKAAQKALDSANLTAQNLDILVVVADTPEYISPTNAIKLAKIIGANNVKVVYDLNANCAGGIVAFDQISRFLTANKYFYNAMIITSFYGSYIRNDNDPIAFSTFSDSAAAVILQKKTEDRKRGFIDSAYRTDCSYDTMDVFPANGFKDILVNGHRDDAHIKLGISKDMELSFVPENWEKLILELLGNNNLNPEEIEKYIFSQFSLYHIRSTMALLKLKQDKFYYNGDVYGYNGCCSPYFALANLLSKSEIPNNKYIVLSAIGAGFTSAAILYSI